MIARKTICRRSSIERALFAALMTVILPRAASTEPCNPIIDGTYCATQMPQGRTSQSPSRGMAPVRSLGNDFNWSTSQDSPGTLGSISFRGGGSRCVGSLIRSRCT